MYTTSHLYNHVFLGNTKIMKIIRTHTVNIKQLIKLLNISKQIMFSIFIPFTFK